MKNNLDIFKCPICSGNLDISEEFVVCIEQEHRFNIIDDIPMMFIEEGENEIQTGITQKVKNFYEENPFPNYDESDNIALLISKAESTVFAKLLNDELPFNTRTLEVGCGTGQLSNYLSIAHRYLFGIDISLNSLVLANNFKRENSLNRSSFYQMNLFSPIFKDNSFNVIICNGVLHHTHDAFDGFHSIIKLLKKGGFVIIGLYNRFGRLSTNIRRELFKVTGNRFHIFDPFLMRKDITHVKKNVWYIDQYKHPHETTHTYGEVLKWFKQTGIEYISSIPEIGHFSGLTEDFRLFTKKSPGNLFSRFITQFFMPLTGHKEGGFFIIVGRKT